MKHLPTSLLLFVCLLPSLAFGQNDSNEQQITIPSSPAFSILSFEPAAVMKPTGTKELAADVLSAFGPDGKLLMNLGLEVSPYWLKSHPALTAQEYIHPSPLQTIKQTLTLSAATVKDSATGNNNLGAGFRFMILNGQPVDSQAVVKMQLQAYNQLQALIATARRIALDSFTSRARAIEWIKENAANFNLDGALLIQFEKEANALMPAYTDNTNSIKEFLRAVENRLSELNRSMRMQFSRLLYQRKGFALEFAGASAFNMTQHRSWEKVGAWATASYFVSRTDLFAATARFMSRNSDTLHSNFDLGFAYLKEGSQYNLSLEGLLRWYWMQSPYMLGNERLYRHDQGFTYRLAAQVSYRILKDVSVNFSLGKEFEDEQIQSSGFFSILGFNYSLFAKRKQL